MDRIQNRIIISVIAAFVAFSSFPKAFADQTNGETSSTARALGMGNAAINTERGGYSVFYNPANIAAKDTRVNVQLLNVQNEFSDGALAQLSSRNSANFLSLSSLSEGLIQNPNRYVAGRFSVYPNFTVRNFSLGMLYEVNQGAIYEPGTNSLRIRVRNRFAPTAALSFRLFGGIFRFGFSTQLLGVGEADRTISMPQTASARGDLSFKKYAYGGTGFVHTVGTTVTIPVRFLPSFSGVIRNLGVARFAGPSLVPFGEAGTPMEQAMRADAAFGLTMYMGRRIEFKPEFDFRDVTNRTKTGLLQRMSFGGELIFFDSLKFRAGVAHGYLSVGAGVQMSKGSVDFAAYGDELDNRLRSNKEQRYVLQYTWSFFR